MATVLFAITEGLLVRLGRFCACMIDGDALQPLWRWLEPFVLRKQHYNDGD